MQKALRTGCAYADIASIENRQGEGNVCGVTQVSPSAVNLPGPGLAGLHSADISLPRNWGSAASYAQGIWSIRPAHADASHEGSRWPASHVGEREYGSRTRCTTAIWKGQPAAATA